jgi:hypothetical protein
MMKKIAKLQIKMAFILSTFLVLGLHMVHHYTVTDFVFLGYVDILFMLGFCINFDFERYHTKIVFLMIHDCFSP